MTIQGWNAVLETITAPSASNACKSGEIAKGQQTAAGTAPSASFPWGPEGYTKAAKYHLLSCFSLATPSDTARTERVSSAIFMHRTEEMTQRAAVLSRSGRTCAVKEMRQSLEVGRAELCLHTPCLG